MNDWSVLGARRDAFVGEKRLSTLGLRHRPLSSQRYIRQHVPRKPQIIMKPRRAGWLQAKAGRLGTPGEAVHDKVKGFHSQSTQIARRRGDVGDLPFGEWHLKASLSLFLCGMLRRSAGPKGANGDSPGCNPGGRTQQRAAPRRGAQNGGLSEAK